LLEHFDTIHNSPSHIYHSALPFPPSSSWLHKCYSAELSQEVQVAEGLPAEWGTCLCTISLDSRIYDLSYQNNAIAVGTQDGDIIILNAITGSQTAVLSGHAGPVESVAYSPDGRSLVSGSLDNTVKLWDVQTGGVVKTFYGHADCVSSVSVSADCARIASGSWDKTIRLWDIQTGECYCVIDQEDTVYHVSFSPTDPQHLLFICEDKVRQWDIDGHQAGHAYDGTQFAFSSDGTQSVSSYKEVIKVKNSGSGVIIAAPWIGSDTPDCCCFSPDSRLIAAAAYRIVHVWDITSSTPNLIEMFTGHNIEITSLVFSSPSSLFSASADGSIKFWKIGSSSKDPLEAPKTPLLTSIDTRSTTLQAKDGIIITSDFDGVVRTWDILTGLCKASFQTPVRGYDQRDAQLINGKLIFCWNANKKINIWDAEKGKLLLEIDETGDLKGLKMSEDGSRVFSIDNSQCFIDAWSIQTGKNMGRVSGGYRASNLTVDNSRVWVRDYLHEYEGGWDFGTPGSSPVQLPETHPYRLHPNGIMLWDTGLHRIKDTRTGKVVFQLPKRYGRPVDVRWDGQYLVACFPYMNVLILDFGCILK